MSRCSLYLSIGLFVFGSSNAQQLQARSEQTRSLARTRPNIVIVLTDDQGMGDLSCMGNPLLQTPHLDSFYETSTRFTDFHVSPKCAPTRAAILSGRHSFRNGVTYTSQERERMALSTTTFAELLRTAGYSTGIFGKWHLGDQDAYQPYNRGFSEVFIHGAGGVGQKGPGSMADFPPNRAAKGRYFDNVLLHNDTIVQTKGFCTDVFFQAALGWIRSQQELNSPFFALISTNAPHGPMIAPERYEKRFTELGWGEELPGRYGMIENIDDNFGLLISKLDEWKLAETTLVIFMTDNGQSGSREVFTAGFKSGKGSSYEGGTHVPAFWRWKSTLPEGVDIRALAGDIDLFQTFCQLAGAEIPDNIQQLDGRSLLPLLENPSAEWADRKLFIHAGGWDKGTDPDDSKFKNCAVRSTRWRFVNNQELYDIAADPYEEKNVAADYPSIVAEMRAAYETWWSDVRPLMINEDVPFQMPHPNHVRYKKQLQEKGIPDWNPPDL